MSFKMYRLDFGWEIAVPEGWIMEKKEAGSCIFYPEDPEDETTIYASALHSEELEIPTSLHCMAFTQRGSDGVYRIGAGFFTEGDLLSLNVYAKDREKANEAAAGFSRTKFARG